ncbi:MAG: RICIN domain-containing protein [Gordonibacter sp.]|nr:RICIN domain-containing protein [Gordonibacter sp.]
MKKISSIFLSCSLVLSICFPTIAWAEQTEALNALDASQDSTDNVGAIVSDSSNSAGNVDQSDGDNATNVGVDEDKDNLQDPSEVFDAEIVDETIPPTTSCEEMPDESMFALADARVAAPQVATLRTALGNKVLGIVSGSKSDFARVQLCDANLTGAQRFQFESAGAGYYVIVNVNSGKALDVQSANAANGTPVQQYEANGTDAQLWSVTPTGDEDGSCYIESKLKPNLVLDVQWGASSNGTPLQVYEANGSDAQKFYFNGYQRIFNDGLYVLGSAATSTVLDVSAADSANGANIQMYSANRTAAQSFTFKYDDLTGYYTIATFAQEKVLDVAGASGTSGANVWQYDANESMAQKWSVTMRADGSGYTIVSACNGLALDIAGASTANGANIQVYTVNNTAAQTWIINEPTKDAGFIEDGIYRISSALDVDFALDIDSAGMVDGTNVQLFTFNNTWAQKFQIEQQSNGYYLIRALHSGKVLEVSSQAAINDTNVQQGSYVGSDLQLWKCVDYGGGDVGFQSKANGLYLDVAGAVAANWTNIWVYEGNGSAAQRFRLTSVDKSTGVTEGSYVVKSQVDGTVLDIASADTANGARVQLYASNNTFAQKFKIVSAGNWQYYFVNVHSSKYLDVDTGTKTTLQQWERAQSTNQKWEFYPAGEGRASFFIRSPYTNQYLTNVEGSAMLCDYAGDDSQIFFLATTSAFKVYLDAGHGYNSNGDGRIDSGAVSFSYQEYRLTEDLVARVSRELDKRGIEYHIGSGKAYWDRHQDAVNMGCSTFLSVHFNASDGFGTGTESYIHSYNAAAGSSVFQNLLHKYLVEGTGLIDRGKKQEQFAVCGGRLPSILCEIAFIDNPHDMATYNSRCDNVAAFIATGVQESSRNVACGWY